MVNILPSKLAIIFIMLIIISGCVGAKKIAGDSYLLEKNTIFKNNQELPNDPIKFLLVDKPNKKILGIPVKRNIYSLAGSNSDSLFNEWLGRKENRKKRLNNWLSPKQVRELGRYKSKLNNWLKNSGEAPVFLDSSSIQKNVNRLKQFYTNKGYFDTKSFQKTHWVLIVRLKLNILLSPGNNILLTQ